MLTGYYLGPERGRAQRGKRREVGGHEKEKQERNRPQKEGQKESIRARDRWLETMGGKKLH